MIKDAGSKYDDYSISPKIRQILLHWGYEKQKKYQRKRYQQPIQYKKRSITK